MGCQGFHGVGDTGSILFSLNLVYPILAVVGQWNGGSTHTVGPSSHEVSPLPSLCNQCQCISSFFQQDVTLGEFTSALIKPDPAILGRESYI